MRYKKNKTEYSHKQPVFIATMQNKYIMNKNKKSVKDYIVYCFDKYMYVIKYFFESQTVLSFMTVFFSNTNTKFDLSL